MRFLALGACLAVASSLQPANLRARLAWAPGRTRVLAYAAHYGVKYSTPTDSDVSASSSEQLPAGWLAGFDEASGAMYYFHEPTGEYSWELPTHAAPERPEEAGTAGAVDVPMLPTGWVRDLDQQSGRLFYYHTATGECTWDLPAAAAGVSAPQFGVGAPAQAVWTLTSASGWTPRFNGKYTLRAGEEEVLGRYDLRADVPTRPWVSREQCLVHVGADGAAMALSRGKPPTGWSRDGGPWMWLTAGETVSLAHGDQLSLDYQDPEGAVFTCALDIADGRIEHLSGQVASRERRTRRRYESGAL